MTSLKSCIAVCVSLLLLVFPSSAVFAETQEKPETQYLDLLESAKPIERVPPKYPVSMARSNMEGWVRVSFVVDENGAVVDPIIHDSSGLKAFEKSALKAVKQWRYEPAMLNGEPVEQCNSKVQLMFKLENNDNAVSRSFLRHYKRLKNAIEEHELEEAGDIYQAFSEETQRNLAEGIHFSVVSAMYFQAIKDEVRLYRELINIVDYGREYLPEESYLSFLYNRLVAEIQANKLASAKETAEIAATYFPEHAMTLQVADLIAKVNDFVADNDTFVVTGKISGNGRWSHKLLHNKFEVSANKSKFERIEVRCDNKRSSFGGVSSQTVIVPMEWGQCYIYVDAPENTEFSLVEIAS